MNSPQTQFIWQENTIRYRDVRESAKGGELRWLVTYEKILNTLNGQSIARSFIRHPGVCVLVPFVAADQILLMRQYRYAVKNDLWELPAGTIEGREENYRLVATETLEDCAARELKEETGYRAGKLEKIISCYTSPGNSDQMIHLFFADQLTEEEQDLDAGEVIYEIRTFNFREIEGMIEAGKIQDAKTLIGLFYALRRRSPEASVGPDEKGRD